MTDLEGYSAKRVSVKLLRQFLDESGPANVTELTREIRRHDPRLTEEDVEQTLDAHPRVFRMTGAGSYSTIPAESFRVVRVKPRPRPSVTPAPARRHRVERKTRPAPPPEQDVEFSDGGLRLILGAGSGVFAHESGQRLLVTMPRQVADAREVAEHLSVRTQIEVFERTERDSCVARGTRDVVEMTVRADFSSVDVVLGRPLDRDDLAVTGSALALPAGEQRTQALVRVADWAKLQQPVLRPEVAAIAGLPPSTTRTSRAPLIAEARRRLGGVRHDSRQWAEYVNWVARETPRVDQELLEELLLLAMAFDVEPAKVAAAGLELVGDLPPTKVSYAEAMAPYVALLQHPDAPDYALRLLNHWREAKGDDAEIDLVAAHIAYKQNRHADACHLFESLPATSELARHDLETWAIAASDCGPKEQQFVVKSVHDRVINASPQERRDWLREIRLTLGLAAELRQELDLLNICLRTTITFDEEAALKDYRIWSTGLRLEERLAALSVLEECEREESIDALLESLLHEASKALTQPQLRLAFSAVEQLEQVEDALGLRARERSGPLRSELNHRAEDATEAVDEHLVDPLADRIITLIGGNASRRQKLRSALTSIGAREVREVAPHWEARVDAAVVRPRVSGGRVLAVILADEVGHQEQEILKTLRQGIDFRVIYAQGGPSRALREMRAQLAA